MSSIESLIDGVVPEKLIEGLEKAAQNYADAVAAHGLTELSAPEPDIQWRRSFSNANEDVIVPDALVLTEDDTLIRHTELWKQTEKSGYVETQYVFDNSVGKAVAQSLWYAVNTDRARKLLPDKTVALFEINANRGFRRGAEDSAGCYGMPQNWLGYIGIDAYYLGPDYINTPKGGDTRIDYLGEPDSWTTFGDGLERNAARIRIRPAHPITSAWAMPLMWEDGGGPKGELLARKRLLAGEVLGDDEKPTSTNYARLSGEYRIIRAVAVLDDPNQWNPDEFLDKTALWKAKYGF